MIHARTIGDLAYTTKRHSWLVRLFQKLKGGR